MKGCVSKRCVYIIYGSRPVGPESSIMFVLVIEKLTIKNTYRPTHVTEGEKRRERKRHVVSRKMYEGKHTLWPKASTKSYVCFISHQEQHSTTSYNSLTPRLDDAQDISIETITDIFHLFFATVCQL